MPPPNLNSPHETGRFGGGIFMSENLGIQSLSTIHTLRLGYP